MYFLRNKRSETGEIKQRIKLLKNITIRRRLILKKYINEFIFVKIILDMRKEREVFSFKGYERIRRRFIAEIKGQ